MRCRSVRASQRDLMPTWCAPSTILSRVGGGYKRLWSARFGVCRYVRREREFTEASTRPWRKVRTSRRDSDATINRRHFTVKLSVTKCVGIEKRMLCVPESSAILQQTHGSYVKALPATSQPQPVAAPNVITPPASRIELPSATSWEISPCTQSNPGSRQALSLEPVQMSS